MVIKMLLENYLKEKKISMYRLSELSGVPYTTIYNIVQCKANIENCTARNVLRIAKALDLSVEDLIFLGDPKYSYTVFKSEQCHLVHRLGEIEYCIDVLKGRKIDYYWNLRCYAEAMYLVAMIDYLSHRHNIPICTDYNYIRDCKLEKKRYPIDTWIEYKLSKNKAVLEDAEKKSIPEFLRFNIIEVYI
jgi:plasmid maintenance system antidote protein VapI